MIAVSDLFGVGGRKRLAKVPLATAYAERVGSLLELIDTLDGHEARFAALIAKRLDADRGYQAIQQVPGIGVTLAAVLSPRSVTPAASPVQPNCALGPD